MTGSVATGSDLANRRHALPATPLFGFVFAGLAKVLPPAALNDVLEDALTRGAWAPHGLLKAYADRCLDQGLPRAAIKGYRQAVVTEPSQPGALAKLLDLAEAAGRDAPAPWATARRVVSNAHPLVLSALLRDEADAYFAGVTHYDVLRIIGELLRPAVYFEIGINNGYSLDACHPGARRIGVDPVPRLDPARYRDLDLFAITSDEFFEQQAAHPTLPRFELSFLDGLHEAGQLLRDFHETEKRSVPGGTIILHDVLPMHPLSAEPQRHLQFWVGDCWRLLCLLRHERPDLEIAIVPAYPSGLAVIRNLNPDDRRLGSANPLVVEALGRFELVRDFVPTVLALPWVEPTEPALRALLSRRARSPSGWARLRPAANDLHAVLLAAGRLAVDDIASAMRLQAVLEPERAPATRDLERLAQGPDDAQKRLFFLTCIRSACLSPPHAGLARTAGDFLVQLLEPGQLDLVAEFAHGIHLPYGYYRGALFEAKLRRHLRGLDPDRLKMPLQEVPAAVAAMREVLATFARQAGLAVDQAEHLAIAYLLARLSERRAPDGTVERVGPFEVWRAAPADLARGPADPDPAVPDGPAPYNRIGYMPGSGPGSGRVVADARRTRRAGIRRPVLAGSHNATLVRRVDRGFVTDGMLVGSQEHGLLLGGFVQSEPTRVVTTDTRLNQTLPGLRAHLPDVAIIDAPTHAVRVQGVATPGYSRRNSDVFGHFVLDSLGRTLAVLDHTPADAVTVVLPASTPPFVETIYRWFGVRRFLAVDRGTRVEADAVLVADVSPEALSNFALYEVLRQRTADIEAAGEGLQLYLSRRHLEQSDRVLANELELETELAAAGFEIVHPQELAFEAQVALYKGARTIVAAYGSALHVAAVFARPGSKIVEIATRRPADDLVTFYQQQGLDYAPVPATRHLAGTATFSVAAREVRKAVSA